MHRPHPADSLRTIRRHWGDLLAALAEPAVPGPLFARPSVAALAAMRADQTAEYADRNTLAWGETPVPLNLSIVDAVMAVTWGLIELEDAVREALNEGPATRDRGRTPESRRAAAHWAALAVHQRLSRRADGGPWLREGTQIWEHVRDEADRLAGIVTRTLGIEDGRPTVLPWPCPWSGGQLVLHRDDNSRGPYATCSTGVDCTAPVPLEGGRRTWGWRQLPALGKAIEAGDRRTSTAA